MHLSLYFIQSFRHFSLNEFNIRMKFELYHVYGRAFYNYDVQFHISNKGFQIHNLQQLKMILLRLKKLQTVFIIEFFTLNNFLFKK
jgi:hypothetical protein